MLNLDLTDIFAAVIGMEHGLDRAAFEAAVAAAGALPTRVNAEFKNNTRHHYLGLPAHPTLANEIQALVAARPAKHVLVIGIGGSSLGAEMLQQAVGGGATLHILDNTDPDQAAAIFARLDWSATVVNIVTKSGTTTESIAGAMLALPLLRRAVGARWQERVIVTTGDTILRRWAAQQKITVLAVPEPVGGRFSVLSAVGLLPACYAGVDIGALLAGAASATRRLTTAAPTANAALHFAMAMQWLHTHKGKAQLILMPYCHRLGAFY